MTQLTEGAIVEGVVGNSELADDAAVVTTILITFSKFADENLLQKGNKAIDAIYFYMGQRAINRTIGDSIIELNVFLNMNERDIIQEMMPENVTLVFIDSSCKVINLQEEPFLNCVM